MRFVLDASVAITWAMRDEDHQAADVAFREVQNGSVVVPAIWWYEIRNILVSNERRGRIAAEDSLQFLQALEAFTIEIDAPQDSLRVIQLARKHRLSVYDAAYLGIALREQLPLATLDIALAAAASAEGVALLGQEA